MSNTQPIMSKESWWNTTASQPCLLHRSFPQPTIGTGWEDCRTWAVPGSSAYSRQSWLLIPFLPHSFQGSTSLWVPMEVLEAVCSAAGGCVSSAGQRAENWLTEQSGKEQDCLYGLLESLISWIPSVGTAHRYPWLDLIPLPLPSVGPASPY